MSEYLQLFLTFAKIGVMTFGGGYAMLPILQREVCETKKWADDSEIMDYYAIGQCTPGIIAVNVATFIGKKQKGIPGGIVATLGMVFPSLVIITVIAAVLHSFMDIVWIGHAFAGIRVCVCVFILNAVLKLWKSAVVDVWTFIIFALVFVGSVILDLSPVLYVIVAGVAGVALSMLGVRKEKPGEGAAKAGSVAAKKEEAAVGHEEAEAVDGGKDEKASEGAAAENGSGGDGK